MKGYRKVVVFIVACITFSATLKMLGITDAGGIVAIGTEIAALVTVTIYGNIQEHKSEKGA